MVWWLEPGHQQPWYQFILHSSYQGCSWPGDWSQDISSHGTCLSCIVHTKAVHGLVTGARASATMVPVCPAKPISRLFMAWWLELGHQKPWYLFILHCPCHMSRLFMAWWLEPGHQQPWYLFILHSSYQGCAWSGDWSQSTNIHDACLSCVVHAKAVHGLLTGARASEKMVPVYPA